MPTPQSIKWMQEALVEARKAYDAGEVPVGAVVVLDGEIIARAHNEVEAESDATLHAEVLAIRRASEELETWRLQGASLIVTLEPCTMCIGAMILARIGSLYFGAPDSRQGAVGSLYDLSSDTRLPHQIEVFPEILANECEEILKQFFENLRS